MNTINYPKPSGQPPWTKPFAVFWRARIYFLIAMAFYALNEVVPRIISAGGTSEGWQQWILKTAGSLDKVAYAAFIGGIAYIVISDAFEYIWNNSLQAEFKQSVKSLTDVVAEGLRIFTSGLVGMTFESVKVWVEGGRSQDSQIRAIATTSLRKYYGHNENNIDLIDFVTNNIMDAWAVPSAQTWESFSIAVVIRPCDVPGHFEWEEKRDYQAVAASKSGLLPIRLENSVQVNRAHVIQALDKLELTIKVDLVTILNFKAWWSERRAEALGQILNGALRLEGNGIAVDYNGIWLSYALSYDHIVVRDRTLVSIYENSYISDQDRCYSIAIRHPTRNLRASLSIEGMSWAVKPPVVSAVLYQHNEKVVNIESPHKRTCSVSVPGWTLPGLAVVIEWTPETHPSLDGVSASH